MSKYKMGDRIKVIKMQSSVRPLDEVFDILENWDGISHIETKIIGLLKPECAFQFVILLKDGWPVETNSKNYLEIDSSYSGRCWSINEIAIIGHINSHNKVDIPLNCCECKESYPYAEANLKDGKLCCYSCRSTYGWKYKGMYL